MRRSRRLKVEREEEGEEMAISDEVDRESRRLLAEKDEGGRGEEQ